MYDMLIVGAGPAGISAALTAQHRGRDRKSTRLNSSHIH